VGKVIEVPTARWRAKRPSQTSYAELKIKYLHLRIENSGLKAVVQEMLAEAKILKARLAALGY
jgi:hypothetical protein